MKGLFLDDIGRSLMSGAKREGQTLDFLLHVWSIKKQIKEVANVQC